MRSTLSDSESHLMAYVIQRDDLRLVPHSAFHTLEATHMRTILSQLNGSEWYKTFSSLDEDEHFAINELLHPLVKGKVYERELVVLRVLEQNRFNAWMALLVELLRNRPFRGLNNGRVLLAIVREKFVDGKPLQELFPRMVPPPPPPPLFSPVPTVPAIRPPPMPHIPPLRTTVSDLRHPPPSGTWQYPTPYSGPPNTRPPLMPIPRPGPPPGPPPPWSIPLVRSAAGQKSNSISIRELVTDYEATIILTTYNEYTMRRGESIDPKIPHSWSRVIVTQDSAEKHLMLQRVQQFQRRGGNVIEAKLHMTEQQSAQVTRLMDELKSAERDCRFEWCWVEISLYNDVGEIMDSIPKGSCNNAAAATLMHLIAKRSLKAHCKPLDVYNALMNPPPPPPPPRPPLRPGFINTGPSTPVRKISRYVGSSSDSDSGSTSWSSDSSIGNLRRRLRRNTARKAKKNAKGRRLYNDSDSDGDSGGGDEDVIKLKIELKKGDDLVKVLLDKWTPEADVEGRGKGKISS